MTQARTPRLAALVAAVLLLTMTLAPWAPARAVPAPPSPGSTTYCSVNMATSHYQSSATKETITTTLTCYGLVVAVDNNVSYQRDGKFDTAKHNTCSNPHLVTPFSCSLTYAMDDPSGSQLFETMNEWVLYSGQGLLCKPGGDKTPSCTVSSSRGKTFGTSFVS